MKDLRQREQIEIETSATLERIRELETRMMALLRTDPDYNAYAERCEAAGFEPSLPIRTFWLHLDQMRWIEANEPSEPDAAAAYWRKHRAEYTRHTSALRLR
jgi:hypothetical protein